MVFDELMLSTGLAGLFMVRGFVPAFVIALVMRFGPGLGFDPSLIADLQQAAGSNGFAPSWFTSNPALIILGLLAGLEIGATKNADMRAILGVVDSYVKPVMAALTYLGVMNATDATFLESTYMEPGYIQAGFISFMVMGGLVGATWIGANAKNLLAASVSDIDPDDSFGLMRAMSIVGDVWVVVGALIVVLLPVVFALLVFGLFGLIAILRRRAHRRDEESKRACASCAMPVYACAPQCPSCSSIQDDVRDVGFLGGVADRGAHLESHGYLLASVGRCPKCASRLKNKAIEHGCPCCGDRSLVDESFLNGFDGFMRLRLVSVLIVCGLVGLVPVLGFAVAVVIYKIHLVGPYRRYLGRGVGMMMRWGLRALLLIALFFQLVPGVNALVVAAMVMVSYALYRGLFLRRVRSIHEQTTMHAEG